MSEHIKDNKALMATPESAMYSYLTGCRFPKNEYEHYAGRKILDLEAQLDIQQGLELEYRREINDLKAQLADSQRQKAGLRKYADHDRACMGWFKVAERCTCGLDKALQESGNE